MIMNHNKPITGKDMSHHLDNTCRLGRPTAVPSDEPEATTSEDLDVNRLYSSLADFYRES